MPMPFPWSDLVKLVPHLQKDALRGEKETMCSWVSGEHWVRCDKRKKKRNLNTCLKTSYTKF